MRRFNRVFSNEALRAVTSDGCVVHMNTTDVNLSRLTGFRKDGHDLAIVFEADDECGWHADIIYHCFTLHVDGNDCLNYEGTLDDKIEYIKNLVLNPIRKSSIYYNPIQNFVWTKDYSIKHIVIKDTMFKID